MGLSSVFLFALNAFYAAPRFHGPTVPHGEVFVTLVKGGFVLLAAAVVLVLAMRNSKGAAAIRNNKAKNNRPSRSRTNELGSGDLATRAQIQPWLEKKNKFDTILPIKTVKAGDGIATKQGNLVIPLSERNRHVLVIAKTGSGKTTRAILPVLFNDCLCPERSTIVLDSKPEMWDKLVGLTRKYNPKKRIMMFNPLDIERGLSWNILSKITSDTDAKLIANTIISATDNPNSKADTPFFRNNALSLLNSIMVGLLNDKNEKLSMPRVHQLINSGMEPLCKWLEAHPHAIRNSKTFVDLARSGSQNADTIMSELGMRLAAWDLTSIRATTALDELDLEALIAEPTLFIIELRESELEMLRPMANVIVVEILRYLTKRAEQCPGQSLPRPIGIVIDEFASALGRLPDIHVKLNTLRSRNVSIVAAIQSIAQIKANYDRDADSVIAGFSSKILMPNLDFQDSEWASKETGTMTVRFNVSSIGKNKRMIDYFATKNDNVQEQVQQRPVLTPDEIGRPNDNAATFFMPNTPVFQGHLIPYFEVPEITSKLEAAKNVDFHLREAPIAFEEELPAAVESTPAGSDMNAEQVRTRLDQVRESLHFDSADAVAREWWIALEKLNENTPQSVFNLAEQLVRRGFSVAEFYQTFVTSGIDNVEDLIRAIDQNLMSQLRNALGWDFANQHAKDWWLSFEEANKDNTLVVIELAQELMRRTVSIEDFFAAYVHSDCNSVPELLAVLDHSLEELRRRASSQASAPPPPRAIEDAVVQEIPLESQIVREIEPPGDVAAPAQIARATPPPPPQYSPSEHLERISEPPPPRPLSPIVSSREQKERATQSVHVSSYMEMGEELLNKGKLTDFEKLVELAREDSRFPKELIPQLEGMRAEAAKAT